MTREREEGIPQAYRALASLGHPVAQFAVGVLSVREPERREGWRVATEWFQRAAEQGQAEAQCALGFCCRFGLGREGSPLPFVRRPSRQYADAAAWLEMAAKKENATAKILLEKASNQKRHSPQEMFDAEEIESAEQRCQKAAAAGDLQGFHSLLTIWKSSSTRALRN